MENRKIFIGSSSQKGLKVAKAIQINLDHFASVNVWTQAVFKLSVTAITNLLHALDDYDYGIFVYSPDDIIQIGEQSAHTVRDNVIFETGLFVGKLGFDRVFMIKPRNQEMHLPSDLSGIVFGDYDPGKEDLEAATGAFCSVVEKQILELEKSRSKNAERQIDLDNAFLRLKVHLKDKGWKSMSFEKIQANVDPRFDEQVLSDIIEKFPEEIRRCKISEGRYGIKLISSHL